MKNKLVLALIAILIVIAIAGVFLPAGKSVVQTVVGAFPSPTITEALELLGGVTYGKVNSTSTTATTQTLKAVDIVGFDTVIMTPNVGDVTFTLPASSTLANLVPKAGQQARQCWYNASTTSGIDITFAAGTGIDLEVASSTVSDGNIPALTVLSDSSACFNFIRKPRTSTAFDIVVQFQRFVDGD